MFYRWNTASQAYTDGQWNEAIASYEQINSIGLESAALYCNMGNAYYKDGNISRAILNYERALKVDPSYEDARFNLEFMNGQSEILAKMSSEESNEVASSYNCLK